MVQGAGHPARGGRRSHPFRRDVSGVANIVLTAKTNSVPESNIPIAAGGADRTKILFIQGETSAMPAAIGGRADA